MTNPIVIDLSHWNDEPDFETLRDNGTLGIIHKATEGTNVIDECYGHREVSARQAGLLWSSYHYLHHNNIIPQMDAYLRAVGPAIGDRLCIDFEDEACTIDDLEMAVDYLLSTGEFTVAVYGSSHLVNTVSCVDSPILQRTSLWQARYNDDPPEVPTNIWSQWDLWQYSQEEDAIGIDGMVDGNKWHGSEDELLLWFNSVGPQPQPEQVAIVHASLNIDAPDGVRTDVQIQVIAPTSAGIRVTVNGTVVADEKAIT